MILEPNTKWECSSVTFYDELDGRFIVRFDQIKYIRIGVSGTDGTTPIRVCTLDGEWLTGNIENTELERIERIF